MLSKNIEISCVYSTWNVQLNKWKDDLLKLSGIDPTGIQMSLQILVTSILRVTFFVFFVLLFLWALNYCHFIQMFKVLNLHNAFEINWRSNNSYSFNLCCAAVFIVIFKGSVCVCVWATITLKPQGPLT